MNEEARTTDWQRAHACLERARLAMESDGQLAPEEAARILMERTLALAKPMEDVTPSGETIELLAVSLAGERFGVDITHALEAIPLRDLIPVPCTPVFVVGLMNYRGRILAVLDLRPLLGLQGEGIREEGKVVLVEAGGMTFGLYVDQVQGTLAVLAGKVAPPPKGFADLRSAVTRGLTEDLMTVLDLHALARAPEILVNEQIG